MPDKACAYLTGSLFWLAIWMALFCLLKKQRRAMLWTSLCLAPAGPINEIWSLRDYWHPAYVWEFRWGTWRLGGGEDYLLAFALAGIGAGLFEACWGRRGPAPLPPLGWRTAWRLAIWPALGLLLFGAGTAAGLHSIHALILAVGLAATAMIGRRMDLWRTILPLAPAAALAYGLFYWLVFLPLFPGIIEAFWNLDNTWGVRWGGVPLEEIAWAGLTMLFAGPFLRAALTPRPRGRFSRQRLTRPAAGG